MNKQLVFGTMLEQNPVVYSPNHRVAFRSKYDPNRWFSLTNEHLEKHLLLLGGPGSGKTNVINQIVHQLRYYARQDDVFVIFDTKQDYIKKYYLDGDIVIGNGTRWRNHPGFRTWNIYDELAAAGDDWELAAKEISASLFAARQNQSAPFFTNAAQDLFANLLIHYYRRRHIHPECLTNKYLVDQIKKSDTDFYRGIFSEAENPDMVGLNSYFGTTDNPQGLGVFGEMKSMVYSAFVGDFGERDSRSSFSMRSAVRKRGKQAIFIEYDLATGQALSPIYRLLVDLALKETLSSAGNFRPDSGRVWFILDELKLLPHCIHLEDGLNLGRGLGCSIIAGLQSIEQMYAIYGQERGQVICGGFSNLFALSVSDYASRNYIRDLFGRNLYSYSYASISSAAAPVQEREGYVVEEWDIAKLQKGDAIIGLNGHPPFLFTFSKALDN